jgi:hypothetical protein
MCFICKQLEKKKVQHCLNGYINLQFLFVSVEIMGILLRARYNAMSEANSLSRRFDLERLDGRVTDGLGDAIRETLFDSSVDRDYGKQNFE